MVRGKYQKNVFDVQRVRDSSSLPSTTQGAQLSVLFFCFIEFEKWQELESRKGDRRTENLPVAGFSAGCREGRKAERRGAAPSSLPSTTQGAQSSVLFFCFACRWKRGNAVQQPVMIHQYYENSMK